MQKSTFFALVTLGGLLLLANLASAASVKPRPTPINPPPPSTPSPVVSAN